MNRAGRRAQVLINLVGLVLAALCWRVGTPELAVACGIVHGVALVIVLGSR